MADWQFRPPPGQEIWATKEFCTITKAGSTYRLFLWDWQLPQLFSNEVKAVMALQRIILPIKR